MTLALPRRHFLAAAGAVLAAAVIARAFRLRLPKEMPTASATPPLISVNTGAYRNAVILDGGRLQPGVALLRRRLS